MENIVYHYTSPEGAYSILKNKALWFTDCQYLNDKNELLNIREPFSKAYKKICKERGESLENADEFIKSMCFSPYQSYDWSMFLNPEVHMRHGYLPKYRYYVLCASNDHDTANMWNYYVKNGMYRGYNLGLNKNVICNWFSQYNNTKISFIHGNIIYDEQKQEKMIYNKLKKLYKTYDQHIDQYPKSENKIIEDFQDNLLTYINEKKLFFKQHAFECEKEYRFILKVNDDFQKENNLETNYRLGANGIITPYIEWKFDNLKSTLLKQITLSPMIEEELAKASLKRFLRNDVYQSITIVPSSIKLRY